MSIQGKMSMKEGKDRLIVALDVPTHEQALEIVQELDNVFFFKIGLELLMAGGVLRLIEELQERRAGQGGIFIDLKLPGDIDNTITRFIKACVSLRIKFITLADPSSYAIASGIISTAARARGDSEYPKILVVPLLSSSNINDVLLNELGASDTTEYILERGQRLVNDGCDGLIVSGSAIKACSETFKDTIIVSPGIRPSGISSDDHKRFATPSEAIKMGSNYLVVGRPILSAPDKRDAAQKIIDEVDEALVNKHSPALV